MSPCRRRIRAAAAALAVASLAVPALTTAGGSASVIGRDGSAPAAAPAPAVRALGGERFQIGHIVIDKAAARFSVPATVVDLGTPDAPLEFLAATLDSIKLYESLLKLDADAVEFNVACILIGLDAARGRAAARHFDPAPVAGDPVSIWVQWERDGQVQRRPAHTLLRTAGSDPPSGDWVYTGSVFSDKGRFMAQAHGVLIGFAHAPETIIEHRGGLGLGNYGSVVYDPDVLPPPGTRVQIEVARAAPAPAPSAGTGPATANRQ